jgi:hypothetical protein
MDTKHYYLACSRVPFAHDFEFDAGLMPRYHYSLMRSGGALIRVNVD